MPPMPLEASAGIAAGGSTADVDEALVIVRPRPDVDVFRVCPSALGLGG